MSVLKYEEMTWEVNGYVILKNRGKWYEVCARTGEKSYKIAYRTTRKKEAFEWANNN